MQPAYFYSSEISVNQKEFKLSGSEAHHAIKVRRVTEGEIVFITNGEGLVVEAIVLKIESGKSLLLESRQTQQQNQKKPIIAVAQALAKGDRSDLSVELLTEVGVDEIIPWQANRSVSKWDEKEDKALEKWIQISRESSKQSRRGIFPKITNVLKSPNLVNIFNKFSKVIVLDPDSPKKIIDQIENNLESYLLVIGPEGGIEKEELDLFKKYHAVDARLGDSILRTSSAGAIGASILMSLTRWVK